MKISAILLATVALAQEDYVAAVVDYDATAADYDAAAAVVDYTADDSGAVDYNGRLEISRILYHEGGLYVCKAVDYRNESGGEAYANVKVLHRP